MCPSIVADVFDVSKPIHFCSKIVGISAFTIKRDGSLGYRSFVSICDVLCLITVTTWNAFHLYRLLVTDSVWLMNPGMLTNFYEKCLVSVIVFDNFLMNGLNLWFFWFRERIVAILEAIRNIDEALEAMNVHIDHSKHRRIILITLILAKSSNFISVVVSYINGHFTNIFRPRILVQLSDVFGLDYCIVYCLQCIFFLLAVRLRYQKVNQLLERLHTKKTKGLETNDANCQRLAVVHDKLVEVTSSLSICYGIPVSFCVS